MSERTTRRIQNNLDARSADVRAEERQGGPFGAFRVLGEKGKICRCNSVAALAFFLLPKSLKAA
jgi:hypothetical protein